MWVGQGEARDVGKGCVGCWLRLAVLVHDHLPQPMPCHAAVCSTAHPSAFHASPPGQPSFLFLGCDAYQDRRTLLCLHCSSSQGSRPRGCSTHRSLHPQLSWLICCNPSWGWREQGDRSAARPHCRKAGCPWVPCAALGPCARDVHEDGLSDTRCALAAVCLSGGDVEPGPLAWREGIQELG